MPFDAFLEKRIFEPLGMVDTRFGILDDQRDRLAKLYGCSDAVGFIETVEFSPRLIPSSIPRGGFGLISTAPDYMQFAQILLNKGDGIDPTEELIFLLMTRLEYPGHIPIYYAFRTLVYQAIIK
jgi:CubicO group peptidase (beta-lactamase class C family)